MPYGFKYVLVLPDGEAPDPAAYVTAVQNWHVGQEFMAENGAQLRIVHILNDLTADQLDALHDIGVDGVWTVEPFEAPA